MNPAPGQSVSTLPSLRPQRDRVMRLVHRRDAQLELLKQKQQQLTDLDAWLETSVRVSDALEHLSQNLFKELLGSIEESLSIALCEVLDQPDLRLKSQVDWKHSKVSVDFVIERNGNEEDIMRGQGGSVANVLSVGLRMFALMSLDKRRHQRFLVLDEQDCWLRPDLVPNLVKIIRDAGRSLGLQVLMISHHDAALFERSADKVFTLKPSPDGVTISEVQQDAPVEEDE